jgi:hypothetical protein
VDFSAEFFELGLKFKSSGYKQAVAGNFALKLTLGLS